MRKKATQVRNKQRDTKEKKSSIEKRESIKRTRKGLLLAEVRVIKRESLEKSKNNRIRRVKR